MSTVNELIPFYDDGEILTGQPTTAIVGKTFVKVSGARTGPELNTSVTGGNIAVAPCGSGERALGVAGSDAATTEKVAVWCTGHVVPVTSAAGISAGEEVQSDGAGNAIPLAMGKALGLAVDDCASGDDAQIKLY